MKDENRNLEENKVVIGAVWSTKPEPLVPDGNGVGRVDSPRCVVIILDDKDAYDPRFPEIRIAPISTELEYACDADLILSANDNPLGEKIMIELWNSQPMLRINLDRCLGELSEGAISKLSRLNRSLWGIHESIEDVETGEPIEDVSDDRADFHEREAKATAYLSAPVGALMGKWEREEFSVREIQIILDVWRKSTSVLWETSTPNCLSEAQMDGYMRGLYSGEDLEKTLGHLAFCPYCSAKAVEERSKRKVAENSVRMAASMMVQWTRVGQFSKILRLSPRPSSEVSNSKLEKVAAKSREKPAKETDAESLVEDSEITAYVFINHQRHVIGHLRGREETIARIRVTLWSELPDGSEEMLSDLEREADESGRVDFGPIDEIPPAAGKGYILKAAVTP